MTGLNHQGTKTQSSEFLRAFMCSWLIPPVNEADWEARYQSGDMPWEKSEPSPGLVDFLAARPELPRGTVLVPGCGTGHDARVWAKAGFAVTGFDLAPS